MHPSDRQLIDLALGETARPEDRDRIARHLEDGCSSCAERLEGFRALLASLREGPLPEPPAAWVERAVALRTGPGLLDRAAAWMKGLVEETARLVFDSATAGAGTATPAFAGTRSGAVARRLRFETRGVELDLQIEPRGRGGVLTGQVVRIGGEPEPLAHAPLLVSAGHGESEAVTDDLGEFRLALEGLEGLEIRVRDGARAVRFPVTD